MQTANTVGRYEQLISWQNLRRMELEDRQRRKSLRDSRPRHQHKSSLVQDITRHVWSRRQSTASWDSHRELRREDDVGLDELDTRSQLTASPKLSTTDMHTSMDSPSPLTPSDPTGPLMQPIPESPQPLSESPPRSAPLRPILEASPMSFSGPTSSSPDISLLVKSSPPPRTMSPEIHPHNSKQIAQRVEGWWTEWLCGCIEEREERQVSNIRQHVVIPNSHP
jgi:hypothetical protein